MQNTFEYDHVRHIENSLWFLFRFDIIMLNCYQRVNIFIGEAPFSKRVNPVNFKGALFDPHEIYAWNWHADLGELCTAY